MKLALNGATIMPSPLHDDVAIAAQAGFWGLEIWAAKLDEYARTHSLEDLARDFHEQTIRPWCINSIENITAHDQPARREVMARLEHLAAIACSLGAPSIVVVPGVRPDGFHRHESVRDAVDVLRAMSEAAGETKLAFEFLGKPRCSVPSLDMALEIVNTVDRPNVGLVIDTFHFHAGGSRLDDIADVPVDKLFVVHLNGCEHLPREHLADHHRLYPGEGAIPIDAILGALRSIGFDGVASVEIFRPEYWEQDPRHVARSAYEAAVTVLTRAGFTLER